MWHFHFRSEEHHSCSQVNMRLLLSPAFQWFSYVAVFNLTVLDLYLVPHSSYSNTSAIRSGFRLQKYMKFPFNGNGWKRTYSKYVEKCWFSLFFFESLKVASTHVLLPHWREGRGLALLQTSYASREHLSLKEGESYCDYLTKTLLFMWHVI